MIRYYFNVRDGKDLPDDWGYEFQDLASARSEAVRMAGEILRDGATGPLWDGTPWQMIVTSGPNWTGETIFVLNFSATQS